MALRVPSRSTPAGPAKAVPPGSPLSYNRMHFPAAGSVWLLRRRAGGNHRENAMKAKEWLYLLGLRPKPRTYGFEVRSFQLPIDGEIQYAQWLHPSERPKTFTQEAVNELRNFLSPGDVAIDIGAHTGDSTLPMALAVGPSGTILALEPNPYVFPILEKNSQLNPSKTHIVPLMFAATPEDAEFDFEYSDSGFCNGGLHEGISRWKHGHAFTLRVQGRNLAAVLARDYPALLPRIRYIKSDAEGYDFTVLSALTSIIYRARPFLRAEVFKATDAAQRQRLFRLIAGFDYNIHRFESDSHYVGQRLQERDLMNWPHYDIFCVPK
jgi:FkbM family methyltransferase